MTYLDTGCFVKLHYPEPDSAKVVAAIQGKPVCYSLLHELEFVNALQLKAPFKGATAAQVTAARALVDADLKSGVLVSGDGEWKDIVQEAAKVLGAADFASTDGRQKRLAAAMGLNLVAI